MSGIESELERLIDDGIVDSGQDLDNLLVEQTGMDRSEVVVLDRVYEEYQSELEALNRKYAEKLDNTGLADRIDMESEDLPFESLLDELNRQVSGLGRLSGDSSEPTSATRIRELKQLHHDGIISDEEFRIAKSQVLSRL
jgi:hypothetical protein